MNEEELRKTWKRFTEKNDFIVNPDKEHINFIVKGLLENQRKFGLRYCPCRIRTGDPKKDVSLICPCNFKIHDTWLKPKAGMRPMCWCGLFVKRQ